MNFLMSRSRRSSRVSSKNNSAEQNNRLKKPSKSDTNTTSRTDESSTDQASLDLLPPRPSLASTSTTKNNKPSQSKVNLTNSSDNSTIDQTSVDLLPLNPTLPSTSLLAPRKAKRSLDKPKRSKRKKAPVSKVGEFISARKKKAMKQTTMSACFEYHVVESPSPLTKKCPPKPKPTPSPSPSKPASLSYQSPPSSLKMPSLSRFSPTSYKNPSQKMSQINKPQRQSTMSQCFDVQTFDLTSPTTNSTSQSKKIYFL